MTQTVVPAVATPMTFEEVAPAFGDAYEKVTGEPLPRTLGESFLILSAVETGRWKSLKNYNFGNITPGSTWDGDVWRPPWFAPPTADTSKRYRELHEAMLKGQAPSAFRAYDTPEAGAFDYIAFLLNEDGGNQPDYSRVIQAMRVGDDKGIVDALHATGYSKDYGPKHYPTFESLRREVNSINLSFSDSEPPRGGAPFVEPRLMAYVILFAGIGAAMFLAKRQPGVSIAFDENGVEL